jgi:hypothetical protein
MVERRHEADRGVLRAGLEGCCTAAVSLALLLVRLRIVATLRALLLKDRPRSELISAAGCIPNHALIAGAALGQIEV